ncbi:MAG TPA: sigma-54 dependent transcriptional regulator [Terriglobales bacterium]|nr:sigma-54 dependent transcriptional regulator [Terriglobales bacterium]
MATTVRARALEKRQVAVITGDLSALPAIQRCLDPFYQTSIVSSHAEVVSLLAHQPYDAIIFDLDRANCSASEALKQIEQLRRSHSDLVVIATSQSPDPEMKMRASRIVDEFFTSPVDFRDVQIVLDRALDKRAMELESRRRDEQAGGRYSFGELIGGSEEMLRVYDAIQRVAQSNTSVVLRGQSGTGKELVAKSIVAMGPRRAQPFVSLNCAALPEQLIESELFGHEKGAFTGAHAARPGQIELADGGTLFLDEISTLPPSLQTKLLRVLEERQVQRLGGKLAKKIDFRLLTATNDNLEEMVKAGRFREDLYYRIHVIPIHLPALRERHGDIALLADHFLRIYCAANRLPIKRLQLEALEVLEEYSWPGNVRELQNLIQRLVLMVEGRSIEAHHLPQPMLITSTAKHESLLIPNDGIDFDDEMTRIEAAYVRAALHRAGGKKVLAAALLKVNVQKLKYLCRKHKLDKSEG